MFRALNTETPWNNEDLENKGALLFSYKAVSNHRRSPNKVFGWVYLLSRGLMQRCSALSVQKCYNEFPQKSPANVRFKTMLLRSRTFSWTVSKTWWQENLVFLEGTPKGNHWLTCENFLYQLLQGKLLDSPKTYSQISLYERIYLHIWLRQKLNRTKWNQINRIHWLLFPKVQTTIEITLKLSSLNFLST